MEVVDILFELGFRCLVCWKEYHNSIGINEYIIIMYRLPLDLYFLYIIECGPVGDIQVMIHQILLIALSFYLQCIHTHSMLLVSRNEPT